MLNKKGDMTLNIVIAAAIAMVVLVVMILIFTGKIVVFNQPCPGEWVSPAQCGKDGFNAGCVYPGTYKAPKDTPAGMVCCYTSDQNDQC